MQWFSRAASLLAPAVGGGARFLISHALLADETYVAGLRDVLGGFRPRSLLILDEAHHAAPASGACYATDSQFTRAVRGLAEWFEQRLFLTAMPYNGHSNSFFSQLEILDPQRFTHGVPVRPRDLDRAKRQSAHDRHDSLAALRPTNDLVQGRAQAGGPPLGPLR